MSDCLILNKGRVSAIFKRENSSILALVVFSVLPVACQQAPDWVIGRRKIGGLANRELPSFLFLRSPGSCSQAMIPEDF